MSRSLLVLAGSLFLFGLMPTQAGADPYPWCAVYGSSSGAGTNCGFLTLAQCRATISGMGGFCEPNQFYTGPAETRPVRKKRHGYE